MAKLDNSKRSLFQAVHTRVTPSPSSTKPERAVAKWGVVAALQVSVTEVTALKAGVQADLREADADAAAALNAELEAIGAVEAVTGGRGSTDPTEVMPVLAPVDADALARMAERLVALREARATAALATHARLLAAARRTAGTPPAEPEDVPPEGFEEMEEVVADVPGARLYRRVETGLPLVAGGDSADGVLSAPQRHVETTRMVLPSLTTSALSLDLSGASLATSGLKLTTADLAAAAADAEVSEEQAADMLLFAHSTGASPHQLGAVDFPAAVGEYVVHLSNTVKSFKKSLEVEPVGLLHLERMTFSPDGIERGELAYSVPLAPGEEVHISHKEWSHTSEEFQKIVTDYMEEFSEEGVAEKTELAQSTSSQNQHSNGLNTGVTASGGYGPVQITSSVAVTVQDAAQQSQQFSRNHGIAITRKASSRSKREHKVSFKVTSASGTEDTSARKIVNPFADRATRVDYYQLIRKWEVNVYRYGIRLTYDITIPEPGIDVLTRIQEIRALTALLQQGFDSADAKEPWAVFTLKPSDINRSNFAQLASQYNATVPPPPAKYKWYDVAATHQWKTAEEAERNQFFQLEVTVDDDYAVEAVVVDKNYTHYVDEDYAFGIQGTSDFMGKSGKRVLIYRAKYLGSLYVELRVRAKLRKEAASDWQLKAWTAMRDAAQAAYYEKRQMLKERVSQLMEELGAQDALSLRKAEREEVMKGVLRWLFGPEFRFTPKNLSDDLYDASQAVVSEQVWSKVLLHGELTRFLHQAIEWENVLYFLYPYFWSHLSRWNLKKFLDHPDALHRAFLKAGSARVVLTIRPGFERDFVSLVETGAFDALSATHPYMTIIEEMEAYAQTNYPGIPPANPEGAYNNELGLLIGTWHEYTPTSALDVAFDETMPSA